MPKATALLLVAHDAASRSALARALGDGGFSVDAAGSGAEGSLRAASEEHTAMVVVDGLVDQDAMAFLRAVTKTRPHFPVVAILARGDDLRVIAAIRAGARGCLYMDDARKGVVVAVREAQGGGKPMSDGMAPLLLEHIRSSSRRSSTARPAARPLTERERVVLDCMARGLSYDETGTAIGVSVNTIRTYVRAIYDKLDVASRTEAVLLAIKLGIIKGTP
jgi:DNA-binding NarL/FixJ family response regulator